MSNEKKFIAYFKEEQRQGLADIKFSVRHPGMLSAEELFDGLSRINAIIYSEGLKKHTVWDDVKPSPSSLLA